MPIVSSIGVGVGPAIKQQQKRPGLLSLFYFHVSSSVDQLLFEVENAYNKPPPPLPEWPVK